MDVLLLGADAGFLGVCQPHQVGKQADVVGGAERLGDADENLAVGLELGLQRRCRPSGQPRTASRTAFAGQVSRRLAHVTHHGGREDACRRLTLM